MAVDNLEVSSSDDLSSKNQTGLSSVFYQVLLFIYQFFYVSTYVTVSVVGLTYYVSQLHLSYVFYLNSSGFAFLTLTVAEFIVSNYADKSESKYGRRKPYVVLGCIIACIGIPNYIRYSIGNYQKFLIFRHSYDLHSTCNIWNLSASLVFSIVDNKLGRKRHFE
jgi:hypothetical protein